MSVWRQLTRGVRILVNRKDADRELAGEVQHFLDERVDELLASGMSQADAMRRARLDIGNGASILDEVRASAWEHLVSSFVADLRYGARRLRRDFAFTAVAVATLALGVGAATTIFSIVDPVLLKPLPYPKAADIVSISDISSDYSPLDVTFGSFREIATRSTTFDALAVMKPWQPTIVGARQAERLDGQRVSVDYFRVLGLRPRIGRIFDDTEDRPAGPNVVLLSDGLWHRQFGADPAIVGRTVSLDGVGYTVIGVMARAFENVTSPSADVWAPLQYDPTLPVDGREWGHHLKMLGRLRRGVGLARGRDELRRIADDKVAAFPRVPWATLPRGLLVTSLQDAITRDVRPTLVAVGGGVLVLLLIACVNVANLQLARGAQRRGEFAMRAALGAGRMRLLQQLAAESLLIAGASSVIGLAIATVGVDALVSLAPAGLPRIGFVRLDLSAFAFAASLAVLVALGTGLFPVLHGARGDAASALQLASSRVGRPHQRVRRALVIAEVALAIVLLVGAGLLLNTMRRLFAIDPGFRAAGVLAMQVQTAGPRYTTVSQTHRFFADVLATVQQVPNVGAAAFANPLPLLIGLADGYGVRVQPLPGGADEPASSAFRYAVTPGYLETMGIRLLRGRTFDTHDTEDAPKVALVSESVARKVRDGDAVGQWVRVGSTDAPWRRVVGVVSNVRQLSLELEDTDAVYLPNVQWSQATDRAMWLVVRTRGDAARLTDAVKNAVWQVDSERPIVRASTMSAVVEKSADERRFALRIIETFAAAALALAAVGLYGILAGSVNERTREIGVRAALGATRQDILSLIVKEAAALTAAGILLGVAAAAAASRMIAGLLFGVAPLDPTTYTAVVALLCVVALLALLVPAARAIRIDPATAMRVE